MSRPGPSPSVVAQCGGEREREREREGEKQSRESIDECTLDTFPDFPFTYCNLLW